jgi:hypothetical protein
MEMDASRKGTTLIDLLMSIAIIALLFGGVYLVYFSIVTAVANITVRSAATSAIKNEIETIRNLPYGSVGTVGGIPAGVIPQTQSVAQNGYGFTLKTTVLNIQDPYDTSPSSSPVADYKLVDITASCPLCENFVPVEITTTVAPSLLAQGTDYGSIFINVIDANGGPVPTATVEVVNASVTPSIDLTDTVNASGVLKLIGVPTSTQGYQIFVSKPGYSSAQTYPLNGTGNPNPVAPNITVASQTVSNVTFSIDRTSALTVRTEDNRCNAIGSEPFSIAGSKLIGTSPDVLKFATTSATSASGAASFPSMEWDTYALGLGDPSLSVAGTIPLDPLTIDPSSTASFAFILAPAANPSLLITAADDATGAGIPNASITATNGATSITQTTDHAAFGQTNWTGGQYASQDGNIDTPTGVLTLLANASGTYDTGTLHWLVSNTFDIGGSASATFNAISWAPSVQPPDTSVEFQVAANNDNATWNFIGPDGTGATYFTVSSTLPASLAGDRYFRYKAYLGTVDPNATPSLDSVSFDFTGPCVPPAQTLFTGLPTGTYSITAAAPNYATATGTVAVNGGYQSSTISMIHQ